MKAITYFFLFSLVFISCNRSYIPVLHESKGVMSYEIPYNNDIITDGNDDEWQGYTSFCLYSSIENEPATRDDFKAEVKFAWNDQGLAFFIDVKDNEVSDVNRNPWDNDGIEIFLTPGYGDKSLLQYAVTAAVINPLNKDLVELDYRRDSKYTNPPKWEVSRKLTGDGYSCEGVIKLDALNKMPAPGTELGIQVYINDMDNEEHSRYALFYASGVHQNPKVLYPFTLSSKTGQKYTKSFQAGCVLIDGKELQFRCINQGKSGNDIHFKQEGTDLPAPEITTFDGYTVYSLSVDVNDPDKSLPVYVISGNDYLEAINLNYIELLYVNEEQPNPFEEDIRGFEAWDSENSPPENPLLVIGSSSIRMWATIHEDLEGKNVIHRGFGGSKAQDVLHFIDRIVLPYKPTGILYYEGDNDINDGMTAEDFIDSTRRFIKIVQSELPGTKIYLLSVKPSIKRMVVWPEADKANHMMQEMAKADKNLFFIDVASAMFDENGELKEEIFLEDGIHMKPEGYEIWTRVIREALGLPPK